MSRSRDVPPFGPPIPDGAMFPKSADFAEFLLTKGESYIHDISAHAVKCPCSERFLSYW